MNYAKQLTYVALLAMALPAAAQYSSGTVNYKVIDTDPDNYKRTVLSSELVAVDTYNDINVGCNFKLETVIGERLMPWAYLRTTWLDAATWNDAADYPKPPGGLKKQRLLDLGATYFFKSKKVKASVKVVLKSSSGAGYTYSKFTFVPSEVRRMTGIRGGMFMNRKGVAFDEGSHPYYRYRSADGLTDLPIENVGVWNGGPQPAGAAYMPLAMTYVPGFFGGLQLRNIKNTVIQVNGYGKRMNAKVVDLYIDVLLATNVTITNVLDADKKEWQIAPQEGALKKTGFRLGYSIHTSRRAGFTFSNEVGKRPGAVTGKGFFGSGAYVTLNFGIAFASGKHIGGGKKKDTVK